MKLTALKALKHMPLAIAITATAAICFAQDEPNIEHTTVLMDPLHFEYNGTTITEASESQRLWNELLKYKLWGTKSVSFKKAGVRINEPSGYTGSATGKIIINGGNHTLGGPIISGGDVDISYPDFSADADTILGEAIRANMLVLPNSYNPSKVHYGGTYCFEHQIYFDTPDRINDLENATIVAKRFIHNVHASGGKIYADWNLDTEEIAGLPDLTSGEDALDGPYNKCPDKVSQSDKKLSVPILDHSGITWEPAITLNSNANEIQYIHIPPITEEDINNKIWYDKYLERISLEGNAVKILYILMPTASHNANKKKGRLTRIFLRDGLNIEASSNRIQVAYVNKDAAWDEGTQSWQNIDTDAMTFVSDEKYTGNLLFFANTGLTWGPTEGDWQADLQGTYITAGDFSIKRNQINIAGQLIAGKDFQFNTNFDGTFHFVPFNTAEIKTDIFVKDSFEEDNRTWYNMDFYLTDTARTDVSFDYCFAFFGIDVDTTGGKYDTFKSASGSFAEPADINKGDATHNVPFCKDGNFEHIVIEKGQRHLSNPKHAIWLQVTEDGKIEGNEYLLFKISNLSGASISGTTIENFLLVKLVDTDNQPPHFVDIEKLQLAVLENATKAIAGKIKADDDEGDAYFYEITGGTAQDLFEISLTTGIVKMKNGIDPFDYEAWKEDNTKYTIKVELCDTKATSFSTLLCSEATFSINITDVNEKPFFDYKDADKKEILIPENHTEATVKTADTDIFSKESQFTNNEVIALDGDTDIFGITKDGTIFVQEGAIIDYEKRSTYSLKLRIRDAMKYDNNEFINPDLYEDMDFTIVVTDVDDAPKFSKSSYEGFLDENSAKGATIKFDQPIVATTTQKGAFISYSFIDQSKLFTFNPETRTITLAKDATLDFESTKPYKLKVIASYDVGDENHTVFTDTADVIIKLNDINEKPAITAAEFSVDENAKEGTVIGTVKATDPDANSKFTFALSTDNPYVTVSANGEIKVKKGAIIDYEKMKEFTVKVKVTDAGGLSDEKEFKIKVNDLKEETKTGIIITRDIQLNFIDGTLIANKAGLVQVKFFDMLGHQVANIEKYVSAGTSNIGIENENISAGAYLVQVKFNGIRLQKGVQVRPSR